MALDTIFSSELAESKETDFMVDKHKAGSYISAGVNGNYTFLEAYESGHMVPTDQPEAALAMFSRWLAKKPL